MADRTGARKRWSSPSRCPRPRLPRLLAGDAGHAAPETISSSTSSPSSARSSATSSSTPCCRASARARRSAASPAPAGRSATSAASCRSSSSSLFLAPAPGGTRRSLGIAPIFGLDPAARRAGRATGPLSALWYLVFALPLFLFTPDEPARRARRRSCARALPTSRDLPAARRHRSFFAFLDRLDDLPRRAGGALHLRRHLRRRRARLGPFQLGVFGIVAAGVGTVGAWAGGRADRAFGPRPVIVA